MSQATGTAVRVVDFLRSLPVRRQTAMKTSAKSLADIKLLLQAYTLARPFVRFSMKVVKAKTEKGNWMYAPKIGDCIPDAVVKIFGKRLADQCQWNVWSSSSRRSKVTLTDDGDEADSHASYTIEAFLPTPKYGMLSPIPSPGTDSHSHSMNSRSSCSK